MPDAGVPLLLRRMISLITGIGDKGQIGYAVAAVLAQRGDRVLLVARDPQRAAERAAELVREGASAHGYACDLADVVQVDALARQVRADHGDRLDALINLAGGFESSGEVATSDSALFDRMLRINLLTAYLTTRAFFPLVKGARGSIVYVASEVVLEGTKTAGVSAYAASKMALIGLMRSVADEGRASGVRANALAPGAVRTAANVASLGTGLNYVEREEVAAAVAFLCSSQAAAISNQVIRLRH